MPKAAGSPLFQIPLPVPGAASVRAGSQAGATGLLTARGPFVGDGSCPVLRTLLAEDRASGFWPQLWPSAWWPVVFTGPAGAGKTSLARAVAAKMDGLPEPDRRAIEWTAPDLARQVQASIEDQTTGRFRERLLQAALVFIDDVELLQRYQPAQNWLVSMLDDLSGHGVPVICTASAHPFRLTGLLPSLRSRLGAGLVVPVAWPGPEARAALLERMARQQELPVEPEALQWLAERFPVSAPLLGRLVSHLALLSRQRGNSPLDQESVNRMLGAALPERGFAKRLVALIARQHDLRPGDLLGTSRQQTTVLARGTLIYLLREVAGWNLVRIGKLLRGKDHSTLLHACRKIAGRCADDAAFDASIRHLAGRTAELLVLSLGDNGSDGISQLNPRDGKPVDCLSTAVHGGSAS